MAAYIISRVRIEDAEGMQRYVRDAPATVREYGGRYLVRGGTVEALEGEWEHDRLVVLEFDTKQAALAWYHSADYRPQRDLRQSSASAVILLVDGVVQS
jgi:uncharacterized protein (DUF1330 family)